MARQSGENYRKNEGVEVVVKSSLFDLVRLKELGGFKAGDLLAVDPELEVKFMQHIGRTVKHDKMTSNLVLKTGLSAYTREPLNVFLRGPSSIGKTYVVVNSLTAFPKEDVWFLGGLSPTALVHDRGLLVDKNNEPIEYVSKPEKDATIEEKEAHQTYKEKLKTAHYLVDMQGKILVFLEAPNPETFNKLRPILSHDVWETSYKFTDKTSKGGPLQTMHVIIRGWPATVFCSTSERFVQDLATRSFTFAPETTEAKYKDANILSGSKVAFPWKYEQDLDQGLLESYVTFFKNHMKELQALIPYGKTFGGLFPAKFPRSMRDFKHVLGLIEVSALFHLAQRPLLVRKLKIEVEGKDPAIPEYREEEHVYVMAVKQDYDNVMTLWKEIRETTETSAAGHHLTFFHKIVEPMAKKTPSTFTVADLTDAWNAKFSDRKSSDTIRKWVDFLCEIDYMSKEPSSTDKRQNLLKVIQEKINGNYPQNDLSVFFKLDSLNAWLNEARQITAENHISLRENLVTDVEMSPEDIYLKYFYSEKQDSAVIVSSQTLGSTAESEQEKTEYQKSLQYLHLKPPSIVDASAPSGPSVLGNGESAGYKHRDQTAYVSHTKTAEPCYNNCGLASEWQVKIEPDFLQCFCNSCFDKAKSDLEKSGWKVEFKEAEQP
jgi:hypothetical protein